MDVDEDSSADSDTTEKAGGRNIRGKIKSIHCRNFVTYEECNIYPQEYLNIIIGPNGNGKSTLVAAVVLCLGGEPKLLSRSFDIQDYIKRGESEALVKVEIYANEDGESVMFERSFDRSGKSVFKVNSQAMSKKSFLTVVADYKIQIWNLCQFLPQDRVQDFAKMNSHELLVNTINSVCSQETIDQFTLLKELRTARNDAQKFLEISKKRLKTVEARKTELYEIVQRNRARTKCLERIKACEAKNVWNEVQVLREEVEEKKTDMEKATEALRSCKEICEKAQKMQAPITAKLKQLKIKISQKEDECKRNGDVKTEIFQKIDQLQAKIRDARATAERKKRERGEREAELENYTTLQEGVQNDLQSCVEDIGAEADRRAKLKLIEQQLMGLRDEIHKNIKKRSEINATLEDEYIGEVNMLKNRMERSKNYEAQKLDLLRKKFPDVYAGIQWVKNNQHQFAGKVYQPMLLELNVQEPSHVKYFENTIPLRDLLAFTCEDATDVTFLVKELCDKQKLSINFGHAEAADNIKYTAKVPIEQLRPYGFTDYMINLIEGPPAILNYLCSLYHIHEIPIGTEKVDACAENIPLTIRQYFGGDKRYVVSVSKYTNLPSMMTSHIKSKMLLSSIDPNDMKNLRKRLNGLLQEVDKLKNIRTSVEAKINELEFERNEVLSKKRVLDSKVLRLNQLTDQYKRMQQKVTALRSEISSIEDIDREFNGVVQSALKNIIQLHKDAIKMFGTYKEALVGKKIAEITLSVHACENAGILEKIKEAEERKSKALSMFNTISRALENQQKQFNKKMEEAKAFCNNTMPNSREFPFAEAFKTLPEDAEELLEHLHELTAQLDCMAAVDPNIAEEYERKCAELEKLQKVIESQESRDTNAEVEINVTFQRWYVQISSMVDSINVHFGNFMASMGYLGEVSLSREAEHDFQSYGIKIMVGYRLNEPLQILTRHVQSGGERAVAIAVYSMSLQHLTQVPFRCVDEINQGMDSRNERKIFDMIVNETTKHGRAQYFFITPKLLPHLTYNDKMAVHIVFNGKNVEDSQVFPH